MQGVPVPRDELPSEVWQLLPAHCTIRCDEEFFSRYQFEVLILALNKRADGAALARLRIAEQLWPGLGPTARLTLAQRLLTSFPTNHAGPRLLLILIALNEGRWEAMVMGKKGATRCPGCNSTHIEYQGQDEAGNQKWRCRECGHRFTFKPADVKTA